MGWETLVAHHVTWSEKKIVSTDFFGPIISYRTFGVPFFLHHMTSFSLSFMHSRDVVTWTRYFYAAEVEMWQRYIGNGRRKQYATRQF
jgi:hypothetical protein